MKSEFEFINYIKKSYGLNAIGDDCAVLPKDENTDMVITADMLVEDIDFRLKWSTPESLGHKALAVSLSDIAAMGAAPKWAMLSIAVPSDLWKNGFVDRFYEGWYSLADEHGIELIGGDISRAPERLTVNCMAGGEVEKGKAVMRSGAQMGDQIYVTGPIGNAAGGLWLLENGIEPVSESGLDLLRKQLRPSPRVSEGISLNHYGVATSMIDISDGLSSDLGHICVQSSVGARVYAERIPIDQGLNDIVDSEDQRLMTALNGGEDFELLFTAKAENVSAYFKDVFPSIGDITANVGVIELVSKGQIQIVQPRGYQHF